LRLGAGTCSVRDASSALGSRRPFHCRRVQKPKRLVRVCNQRFEGLLGMQIVLQIWGSDFWSLGDTFHQAGIRGPQAPDQVGFPSLSLSFRVSLLGPAADRVPTFSWRRTVRSPLCAGTPPFLESADRCWAAESHSGLLHRRLPNRFLVRPPLSRLFRRRIAFLAVRHLRLVAKNRPATNSGCCG
jgi:hypothetical protein